MSASVAFCTTITFDQVHVKQRRQGRGKQNQKSNIENRKTKNEKMKEFSFSFFLGGVEAGAAAVLLFEFILFAHH